MICVQHVRKMITAAVKKIVIFSQRRPAEKITEVVKLYGTHQDNLCSIAVCQMNERTVRSLHI
jgi:hypothetical protein